MAQRKKHTESAPSIGPLTLHHEPGDLIWYQAAGELPVCSRLTQAEFLVSDVYEQADAFRVVALSCNIGLIVEIYQRRLSGEIDSLQVCSPLAVTLAAGRQQPARILGDAAEWRQAPSMGGWQELTAAAFQSYLLGHLFRHGNNAGQILDVFVKHPVYAGLSFIPHLAPFPCCELLAAILDPRFYIDTNKPNSTAKLESFLGLSPAVASGKRQHRRDLYELVLATCNGVADADQSFPGNFLCRYWNSCSKLADLRTSQLFVRYLRSIWLDSLYRQAGSSEPLFVPEHFFDVATAVAFRAHMAQAEGR